MVLGSLAAVVNDGLVRVAIDDGLGVYQAVFLRGCGMILILIAAGRVAGDGLGRRAPTSPLVLRIAAEVVVVAAFFTAIVHVEFASAQTILMTAPLVVTVVAARRGELVRWHRYVLVVVGFVGVVMVARPTADGSSPWLVLVAVAAAAVVVREFATRRVDPATPPRAIALLTALAITMVSGPISIISGWAAITSRAALALVLACACLVVGYLLLIETVRVGDLSFSAQFRYTTVVGAVVVGLVFFGERPDLPTIVGCALIVLAGAASTRADARPTRHAPTVSELPARVGGRQGQGLVEGSEQ